LTLLLSLALVRGSGISLALALALALSRSLSLAIVGNFKFLQCLKSQVVAISAGCTRQLARLLLLAPSPLLLSSILLFFSPRRRRCRRCRRFGGRLLLRRRGGLPKETRAEYLREARRAADVPHVELYLRRRSHGRSGQHRSGYRLLGSCHRCRRRCCCCCGGGGRGGGRGRGRGGRGVMRGVGDRVGGPRSSMIRRRR
jgi:hypothetical protein